MISIHFAKTKSIEDLAGWFFFIVVVIIMFVPTIVNDDQEWFQRSGSFLVIWGVFIASLKISNAHDDILKNEVKHAKEALIFAENFISEHPNTPKTDIQSPKKTTLTAIHTVEHGIESRRLRWLWAESGAICSGTLITAYGDWLWQWLDQVIA